MAEREAACVPSWLAGTCRHRDARAAAASAFSVATLFESGPEEEGTSREILAVCESLEIETGRGEDSEIGDARGVMAIDCQSGGATAPLCPPTPYFSVVNANANFLEANDRISRARRRV
jgi:hypothetical protein